LSGWLYDRLNCQGAEEREPWRTVKRALCFQVLVISSLLLMGCRRYSRKLTGGKVALAETKLNTRCSRFERAWGEWCVYTGGDDIPDVLIPGFANIYHPSAWLRGGSWSMVAGGWETSSQRPIASISGAPTTSTASLAGLLFLGAAVGAKLSATHSKTIFRTAARPTLLSIATATQL
jgi:hypothetical protein